MTDFALADFLAKEYTPQDATIIAVERAITELRQGRAVLMHHAEQASYLIFATEMLDQTTWDHIAEHVSSQAGLVIAHNRAKWLALNPAPHQPVTIAMGGVSYHDLQHMIGMHGVLPPHSAPVLMEISHETAQAALQLCLQAELLPSVVAIALPGDEPNIALQSLPTLKAEQVHAYASAMLDSMDAVITAPLHLKIPGDATITGFRPKHGGKDHYAIAIQPVGKEASGIPLVRVHSSCYTGDLLGSITCDCGEQLQSALVQMAEDPAGGVLLYLQQEGRGIGLTNKLRCYHEQSHGYDTVEANEILGFEDDAREFAPAAILLKKLNLDTIRLLSNNPRKAEGLEEYGIRVAEIVPHIVAAADQPMTRAYMEVKKQQLGHRLP